MSKFKWSITKDFDFCYGHRVWNQTLNEKFSVDSQCACRHMHGHQGKIQVKLSSDALKDGMVTDFKHLNWFKSFIDKYIDHKFILDINDPAYNHIIPDSNVPWVKTEYGFMVLDENWKNTPGVDPYKLEIYEGLVLVDFVPTSENLSKWLWGIVNQTMSKLSDDIITSSVTFFETPKSSSCFQSTSGE